MKVSGLKVAIIGGGIGGFASATALAQLGAVVTLYEAAVALGEVGAGIQISANGQAVLRALGAVEGVALGGATISQGTIMRAGRTGRAITRIAAPRAGATWYVHRADLLTALVDAAKRAGVSVELGQRIAPVAVDADVIVAADGGMSAWRAYVDGPDDAQFTGQVAWRAVVPAEGAEMSRYAHLSMGTGAHVVHYPLRGGTVMNLVAVEERKSWTQEGWSQAGDVPDFRARFAAFGGAAGALIARAQDVHIWALHARPVARCWVKAAVVLLGDAAHPTLPFMAQGACLALEDAWVLRECLAAEETVADALARYQALRRTRARRVVGVAQGNAHRFHMAPPFSWGAQVALALGGGILARRLEWVYDYDATRVVEG